MCVCVLLFAEEPITLVEATIMAMQDAASVESPAEKLPQIHVSVCRTVGMHGCVSVKRDLFI